MISSAQCRAARALLNWSRKKLAQESSVSDRTVVDFERGARQPYRRTLRDIVEAFETAGVVFIEDGHDAGIGSGPGLRFKQSKNKNFNSMENKF